MRRLTAGQAEGVKNVAASVVGWLIVAIIVWLLFGWIVGTILWVFRMFVVLLVLGGLFVLYGKLKDG